MLKPGCSTPPLFYLLRQLTSRHASLTCPLQYLLLKPIAHVEAGLAQPRQHRANTGNEAALFAQE